MMMTTSLNAAHLQFPTPPTKQSETIWSFALTQNEAFQRLHINKSRKVEAETLFLAILRKATKNGERILPIV